MHSVLKSAALAASILATAACGGGSVTTATSNGGSSSHAASTGTHATGTGGGANASTTGTGGAVTAAEACAAQAHAQCTELDNCSAKGFENDWLYGSEATCEMRVAPSCVSALMAHGTAQTPAHVAQCAAAYTNFACADFFDDNPPSACTPPAGSLANGSVCGASGQCSSTFCEAGPFSSCGTCQPLPAAGAPCQVQNDCGRDLACVKPAGATVQTVGKCAAWVPMGGPCLTNVDPCETGLTCVGDDPLTMKMGTCKADAVPAGAACDTTRQTAPGCDFTQGLVCIPTGGVKGAGTCQTVPLVAAGQPCGALPGGMPFMYTSFVACEAGGACIKAAAIDVNGTCKAPAADGAACDSDVTKGPPCLLPARCVPAKGAPAGTTAGTCTVPDATQCM